MSTIDLFLSQKFSYNWIYVINFSELLFINLLCFSCVYSFTVSQRITVSMFEAMIVFNLMFSSKGKYLESIPYSMLAVVQRSYLRGCFMPDVFVNWQFYAGL